MDSSKQLYCICLDICLVWTAWLNDLYQGGWGGKPEIFQRWRGDLGMQILVSLFCAARSRRTSIKKHLGMNIVFSHPSLLCAWNSTAACEDNQWNLERPEKLSKSGHEVTVGTWNPVNISLERPDLLERGGYHTKELQREEHRDILSPLCSVSDVAAKRWNWSTTVHSLK